MLRQLHQKGIRQIDGRLLLDRSFYSPIEDNDESLDGEDERPYNVPPDPLAVNFKTLRVQLLNQNGQMQLSAEPNLPGLTLTNQLSVVDSGNCLTWKNQVAVKITQQGDQTNLLFKGKFPAACDMANYLTAVGSHPTFAMASIRDTWAELGGSWPLLAKNDGSGWLAEAVTPVDAKLLAAQSSESLVDIIKDVNKFSNNLMARSVFIAIGRKQGTGKSPINESNAVIRQWLATNQKSFPELVLENGAGLSRKERISANHLADVLSLGWQSSYMPEYMASLPIAGIDGTLKRRFATDMQSSAHLKTGTLNNVRALAGYIRSRSGQWCAFVAILNHPSADRGIGLLDQLAGYVYENY